jgi:hypothetical protein
MSCPEAMIPKPLPMAAKPAARPRARPPNHRAMSPIMGTLVAPLPNPVITYRARSGAKEVALPRRSIETPTRSSAPTMRARAPIRAASGPQARTAARYPTKFPVLM